MSTTGSEPTTRLVFSRWAEAVVALVPAWELVQAAASTATARPPAAASDARPARVNLIVLLQPSDNYRGR